MQQRTSGGGCFVAGTMISAEDGFVPIEEIKVGDRVWSEDTATGEKELKKVKKVFVREKDSIIRLSINGEVINTTEEHPFWIKNQGWIPAGSLKEGDIVKLQSGEYVSIEEYKVVILDESIPVYNFHVEDNECYYVSKQKVLVHNNNPCAQSNHGNSLSTTKKTDLYVLRDRTTRQIKKIGETTRGTKRYTKKYYEKNNLYMDIIDSGTKKQMHFQQHRFLKRYLKKTGKKPELNKSLW